MSTKLLAAFVSAVAVTVVGVYATFGGNPFAAHDGASCSSSATEGSCCASDAAAVASCCSSAAVTCCSESGEPASAETFAAAIGAAQIGVPTSATGSKVE